MDTDKRITWLDAARGYGILLVIYTHVDYIYLRSFLYTFHMPLFFFLSGYVFSQKESFGSFLWSKVKRLIIPYFCLGIPMIIFDVYRQNRFMYFSADKAIGEFMGLLEQKRLWTLWYVACLFWLNILFYVLVRFVKNQRLLTVITIVISVVGLIYFRMGGQPFYWNMDVCMTALPFFYVGYLCRQKEILEKYVFAFDKKWVLAVAAMSVMMVCLIVNLKFAGTHLEMFEGEYGIEPITYMGAFAGILCMILLSWKFDGKVIRYLGKNSMIYYAWHQTILLPIIEEFYRKHRMFQELRLSAPEYLTRSVLSVLIICVVLTLVSVIFNHSFLRVAVGGPLRTKQ